MCTFKVHFLLDFFNSILTLISFSYILYTISERLTYGLLIYAIFGTVVVLIAGNRLIKINYAQLRLEANFRYSILRIRDYAESIAFYRGEFLENKQVAKKLKKVQAQVLEWALFLRLHGEAPAFYLFHGCILI